MAHRRPIFISMIHMMWTLVSISVGHCLTFYLEYLSISFVHWFLFYFKASIYFIWIVACVLFGRRSPLCFDTSVHLIWNPVSKTNIRHRLPVWFALQFPTFSRQVPASNTFSTLVSNPRRTKYLKFMRNPPWVVEWRPNKFLRTCIYIAQKSIFHLHRSTPKNALLTIQCSSDVFQVQLESKPFSVSHSNQFVSISKHYMKQSTNIFPSLSFLDYI